MEEMMMMIVLGFKMLIGIMNRCPLRLQREENKLATMDMIFHHTSSSAFNEEILIDFKRNGDDVCTVPKDTDSNNKLVPCDTSRR
jgi:hypothetical protein